MKVNNSKFSVGFTELHSYTCRQAYAHSGFPYAGIIKAHDYIFQNVLLFLCDVLHITEMQEKYHFK